MKQLGVEKSQNIPRICSHSMIVGDYCGYIHYLAGPSHEINIYEPHGTLGYWQSWDYWHIIHQSDWWFQPTPLKNDGLKVSWKYDIPNMMGKIIQSCSSHHQPAEHTLWSMEITWMENVGKKYVKPPMSTSSVSCNIGT
jgi:hypothetical protein